MKSVAKQDSFLLYRVREPKPSHPHILTIDNHYHLEYNTYRMATQLLLPGIEEPYMTITEGHIDKSYIVTDISIGPSPCPPAGGWCFPPTV